MSDKPLEPIGDGKDVKTFSFSEEELQALQPRQILINQFKLAIADMDFFMQQYILGRVIPRLGIKPDDWAIGYNISEGKLTCTKKPPEIIKPPELILPK